MTIYVVTGPPCGGKTTHVDEHAGDLDVVVDLDRIAWAIGYPGEQIDWSEETPHPSRVAAMIARASLVKATLDGKFNAPAVWIVDTQVSPVAQARYTQRGASFITVDPGPDECHRRATEDERPEATHAQIDRWYGDIGTTSNDW